MSNWFYDLFINEAKPALKRHSGSSNISAFLDGSLTTITIPENCTNIRKYAFAECTELTEVTFIGTPASIDQSTFLDCDSLRTINVPWLEGEIENAPWGAVNATINYNSNGTYPKLGTGVLGKMKLA